MHLKSSVVLKKMFFILIFVTLVTAINGVKVRAEAENDEWIHYEGKVTTSNALNVRIGPGTHYEQLRDEMGIIIQLKPEETVIILEDVISEDGKLWYKVQFVREDIIYEGFATSNYIAKNEDLIITPSPAFEPTATPTTEPTPTPVLVTRTPATPTPSLEDPYDIELSSDSRDSKSEKNIFLIPYLVLIFGGIALIVIIIYMLVKINKKTDNVNKKQPTNKPVSDVNQHPNSSNIPNPNSQKTYPQNPYQQNPYPQSTYPQNLYHPYPQPQYFAPAPTSGMCIAGFVCSLVLTGLLGLIFSIIGIKECNTQGKNGKGLGIAGLVISIIKMSTVVLILGCYGALISRILMR